MEKEADGRRRQETTKARMARRQSQEVQDKTQQDLVHEVLELGGTGLGSAGRGSVGVASVGVGLERGSAEAIGTKRNLLELLNFRGSQGSSEMKSGTEASYKEERRNTEASQPNARPRPDSNAPLFTSKPNLKPKTPLKEVRTGRMKSNVVAGILNDAQRTDTAGELGRPQRYSVAVGPPFPLLGLDNRDLGFRKEEIVTKQLLVEFAGTIWALEEGFAVEDAQVLGVI